MQKLSYRLKILAWFSYGSFYYLLLEWNYISAFDGFTLIVGFFGPRYIWVLWNVVMVSLLVTVLLPLLHFFRFINSSKFKYIYTHTLVASTKMPHMHTSMSYWPIDAARYISINLLICLTMLPFLSSCSRFPIWAMVWIQIYRGRYFSIFDGTVEGSSWNWCFFTSALEEWVHSMWFFHPC